MSPAGTKEVAQYGNLDSKTGQIIDHRTKKGLKSREGGNIVSSSSDGDRQVKEAELREREKDRFIRTR